MKKLLKGGVIHVGDGSAPFVGDILIDGEKITAVAPVIDAPEAELLDVSGRHICPGFVDPHNATGARDITFTYKDHEEGSDPVTPDADMAYCVNANEMELEQLYRVGITTLGAAPSESNVVGGLMAVTHTAGGNSAKLLVQRQAAMKASVSHAVKARYAEKNILMTRMGIFAKLREQLRSEHPNLQRVVSGELPLFVWAETASEIDALLDLLEDWPRVRLVIVGAFDAPLRAERIAKRGAAVILGERVEMSKNVYHEHDLMALAGLPLSFTLTGQYGPTGRVKYLWNAAHFLAAGMEEEEVLRMMCQYPAQMLGVDDRLGTLQEGLLADLCVWTEHPLQRYTARCKATYIAGACVWKEEN